jgi:hypothetical protein
MAGSHASLAGVAHLNIDKATVAAILKNGGVIMPLS